MTGKLEFDYADWDTLQVGKSIFYKIFEQLSGAKSKDARQGVIWVTKPLSTYRFWSNVWRDEVAGRLRNQEIGRWSEMERV